MPYTYKITNIITGEFYIGSRHIIGDPLTDLWVKYFTSSKYVKLSIEKYGVDLFIADVIAIYESKNECFWAEQEIIEQHIDNSLCLNRQYCKTRSVAFINNGTTAATAEKIGIANTGKSRASFSKDDKNRWTRNARKVANTPSAVEKKIETYKAINHQQGCKNSQFGTRWINHPELGNKKCKEKLIGQHLLNGWSFGRK